MSTIARTLTDAMIKGLDAGPVNPLWPEGRVSAERYTSETQLELERQQIFATQPLLIAHASELAEAGQCVLDESSGRPIVVVRGNDGVLRGFLNACRHRGTRLAPTSCSRKAFVCPYHGWTYGLDGSLLAVPHESAFETLEDDRRSLARVPVLERHGFVWLNVGDPEALARTLGPLDAELSSLATGSQVLFATRECERDANWKLIVDLFLEGYHLRTLHRHSVYPFFLDSRVETARYGDHIGAVSARRTIAEATSDDLERDLRHYVTPSFLVFPNTIVIAHPDYVSTMTVHPITPTRVRWVHRVLIEEAPASEADAEHWKRSVELIEGEVFQKEDLHIAEEMQRGLAARADSEIVLGKLEHAILWFHESVDRLCARRARE